MCECVIGPSIVAGWGCCGCRMYNGLQRFRCRGCDAERCKPLAADMETHRTFETYEEAYTDDPEALARIQQALAAAG